MGYLNAAPVRTEAALPKEVAALSAEELLGALGGPTLFDLRRSGEPPLFVSTLLHGNETSGWDAVRRIAGRGEAYEFSWMLFLGNVEAAAQGARSLPGQGDFNRIWNVDDEADGSASNARPSGAWEGRMPSPQARASSPQRKAGVSSAPKEGRMSSPPTDVWQEDSHARPAEAQMANAVTQAAQAAQPFFAVDVHNNSGHNPPYSVITALDETTLAAAAAFSPLAIHARQPAGVQTRRFARFCPAVTIETGQPEDPESAERAEEYLLRCLRGGEPPAAEHSRLSLYENTVRVTVRGDVEPHPGLERLNFGVAAPGQCIAHRGELLAQDSLGRNVTDRYLEADGTATRLKRSVTLSMYTSDVAIARQDCLCYFMTQVAA